MKNLIAHLVVWTHGISAVGSTFKLLPKLLNQTNFILIYCNKLVKIILYCIKTELYCPLGRAMAKPNA